MSSEELSLGELIKELQDVYHKLLDMCTLGYTYSPQALISSLDSSVRSREEWSSLDQEKKTSYLSSYSHSFGMLEFYRDRVLPSIVKVLDSFIEIESKVPKDTMLNITNLLTEPLNEITKSVINGWFVATSRKIGSMEANLFDNYNVFKEKWNSLLNEIEIRMGRFGLKIMIDQRAKELGVSVSK